ncbi:MAG: hypothetical protein WBA31_04915 [Candidatus Dormiibacterota bacterium]
MSDPVLNLAPRTRLWLWLMAAAMVIWAGAYLIISLAGEVYPWWGGGVFISMALIPALLMAAALRGGSPKRLAGATVVLAVWSTILGVLGLVSLIGLPLLLVALLAFRTIPACADGRQGRPDRRWSRRVLVASLVLGLGYALLAIVVSILASG